MLVRNKERIDFLTFTKADCIVHLTQSGLRREFRKNITLWKISNAYTPRQPRKREDWQHV